MKTRAATRRHAMQEVEGADRRNGSTKPVGEAGR
jgi:hypothetical protein